MYRISDIDTAHISHTDTHMHIIHTQHTSHTCAHMRTHLPAPEGLMWSLLPPGPHGNSSGAARLGGLGGVMGTDSPSGANNAWALTSGKLAAESIQQSITNKKIVI